MGASLKRLLAGSRVRTGATGGPGCRLHRERSDRLRPRRGRVDHRSGHPRRDGPRRRASPTRRAAAVRSHGRRTVRDCSLDVRGGHAAAASGCVEHERGRLVKARTARMIRAGLDAGLLDRADLVVLESFVSRPQTGDYYIAHSDGSGMKPITRGLFRTRPKRSDRTLCSPAAGRSSSRAISDTYSVSAAGDASSSSAPGRTVSPSPDGPLLAWLGNDGLSVTGIDGTNPTKIADAPTSSYQYLGPRCGHRREAKSRFPHSARQDPSMRACPCTSRGARRLGSRWR